MRHLPLLLLSLFVTAPLAAQTSPHGPLKIPCESCHTTSSWTMRPDAVFDHAASGFMLEGQHKTVPCASCHKGLAFTGTPSTCAGCHTDIHRGEVGTTCTRCHTTTSWLVGDMVQRHQETRFPLVGAHAAAECQECHKPSQGLQYAGTPVTCVGCHHNDFTTATKPSHLAAGFSSDCIQCHQPDAKMWGTGFDHQLTGFPLSGAHIAAACTDCHVNNTFKGLSHDCYGCHTATFAGALEPNHAAGGFSHDCGSCHTTTSWKPSSFTHDNTAFPLVGAHKAVICSTCHVNNIFAGLSAECVPCHQTDYAGVLSPNHVSGMFSTNCLTCHSMNGWSPSTFDHASTAFPLTGQHMTTACAQCHTNGNYSLVYQTCYQCHASDYAGTANPNHTASGFSQDCQSCHSTSGWSGAQFDHSTTAFALTGHHATIACSDCHTNNNYQLTYQNCSQCHQGDFAGTTNPSHVAQSFSQTCEQCHSTTSWSPATFDHAATAFPLTGHHISVSCVNCHTNGNYQLTYQNCSQCHQSDYAGTTNPNHAVLSFSQTCDQCHSTTTWSPATFDHATTTFSLTGQHASTVCTSCHTNGNYQLTYTDCYQCHQTDYTQPTNPNHVSLLFSHQCESCHTTTTWLPSTFDHDPQFFKIYSGAHQGKWQNCVQCHPSLGQYQDFTCLTCHEHNQTSMDLTHQQVPNYVYASASCYSAPCHRND